MNGLLRDAPKSDEHGLCGLDPKKNDKASNVLAFLERAGKAGACHFFERHHDTNNANTDIIKAKKIQLPHNRINLDINHDHLLPQNILS